MGDATPVPAEPGATEHPQTRPRRNLIRLSVTEARRLFNARHQGKHAMQQALAWSIWRREHQAEARRHHFRRRLKLQQVLAL